MIDLIGTRLLNGQMSVSEGVYIHHYGLWSTWWRLGLLSQGWLHLGPNVSCENKFGVAYGTWRWQLRVTL